MMAAGLLLQLPCLGRPFHLGMLYDSRSETLIPGKTLWDSKILQSNMHKQPKANSNFEIIAEDTLQKKSFSLGIDANLKLSFMGGLVQVDGAAKYIDDRKSSEQQARVTLKYTSTTRFEELTMEQIGSIQYPEVFDDVDATHVVSAVLYGADAFFIFDHQICGGEKVSNVQGRMQALVKAIPRISKISHETSIKMKEGDKKKAEKFICKFYGDLILPSNPSTFEAAVQVYRDLPKLLQDGKEDHSVPKVVYLYPLHKLDGRKQQIIRSISNSLINKLEAIMESLHNVKIKVNDFRKHDTCSKFVKLDIQFQKFISFLEQFRMDLTKRISDLLPRIRGSGAEEKELADLILNVHKSPFSSDQIDKYVKDKNKELRLLAQYLKNMTGVPQIMDCFSNSENDVITLTTNTDYDYIISFAYNVTTEDSAFLNNMDGYLQGSEETHSGNEWYQDRSLLNSLKHQSSHFVEFVKANLDKKDVAFAVTDHSEDLSGPGILLYVDGLPKEFEPPGKPGYPKVDIITYNSVQLTWTEPKYGTNGIESYKIFYSTNENFNSAELKMTNGSSASISIGSLLPKTRYYFKVQAVSKAGVSATSGVTYATTKCRIKRRPAEKVLKSSELIKSGSPAIYKLPLTRVLANSEMGLYKYDIGYRDEFRIKAEKVLMVVGATGAGKSTLINGMANHILGVKWEDSFRFEVISDSSESSKSHAHSQTQHITSYSFHCTDQPYILTIVDTPGFGDTGGIEKDKEIAKKIKNFFSLPGCIDQINGIGFVTQASLARLTPTQKYIFDAVLSKFANDIKDNIFLMTTFADANEPPVLKAVQENEIEYKQSFKFNNSAIFANNTDKSDFNSMFWLMGKNSFEDFFRHFSAAAAKSLTLTREVLREREQLETLVPGLQMQIKAGMDRLSEIEQEQKILKQHEEDIKANKDFEYEIEINKHEKISLPSGTHTTSCQVCCFTCHKGCVYANNSEKRDCCAMDDNGFCTVCPKKCEWTKHENDPFYYQYYDEKIKVKRTHENLKERYFSAKSEKSKLENMISTSEQILGHLQAKVYRLIESARRSKKRLEEIALKPNPLSEIEYLTLLIQTEKEEHQPGWERRVAMCEQLRRDAEILKKLPEIPIDDIHSKSWWRFW